MNNIKVSVCMVTYAQEQFIGQAIESVVMQKVNFPFELVIGEDCGPDKTRNICLEYKEKYPEIIKLNLQEKNRGPQNNFIDTYNQCQGKYIAICEGDDYWTDPYKLQKQVDFMEQHPDFSMCAHTASTLMSGVLDEIKLDKSVLTTSDLIEQDWGIMTASILFRKDMFDLPEWYGKIKNGDYGLQLLLSLKGNIGYLPDNMSVYRQHFGGVSSTLKPLNQAAWLTFLLDEFNKYTKGKYKKLIKNKINRMYKGQIAFAKQYQLRKQALVLTFYHIFSPILPFAIKYLRK